MISQIVMILPIHNCKVIPRTLSHLLSGILSDRAHHINVENHDDNDEDGHAEIDLGDDNDDGDDYVEEEGKVMMIIIATDGTAGCNGFVNSNSAWTLSRVIQNHNQHINTIVFS